MRWILAFHIIAVICWFAGIFYLPRLFVYHAVATDEISNERFKIMERRLFYGIMTPSALIAIFLGIWLLSYNFGGYLQAAWMHAKLFCVGILIFYHIYCGKLIYNFKVNKNPYSDKFYRWFNEFPVLLLIAIVILVVVQP